MSKRNYTYIKELLPTIEAMVAENSRMSLTFMPL